MVIDDHAYPDYVGMGVKYAQMAAEKRIPVCRYVQLAAQRFLDMLAAAQTGAAEYWWSPAHVFDVCDFMEKLPHVEGEWETPTLTLEPWQIWVFCAVFGFRRPNGTRLVRIVYEEVPRKSAKTTKLAGVGLFHFCCEGENGPHIYIGAPKEDQAMKVFNPMRQMLIREPELVSQFGLEYTTKRIKKADGGFIRTIASKGETEDGANPSMCIMEELHAQPTELHEVMRSSLGARSNPLFWQITTAGRRAAGVGWEQRKEAVKVLEGRLSADHIFAVIYTIDDDDKGRELALDVIAKANPMLGVSVKADIVDDFAKEAKGSPEKKVEFMRTRLNIWSMAAAGAILPEDWDKCADPGLSLADFVGQRCWIGVDLASRSDMNAMVLLFERGDSLYAFARHYIPEEARAFLSDTWGSQLKAWNALLDPEGVPRLVITAGGISDFATIEADIRGYCTVFDVEAIVFDNYQSNQIATALMDDNLPSMTMQPGVKSMSDPTKDVIARVEAGKIRHDGNPVLAWNAANTVVSRDTRDNIMPKKEGVNSDAKIDGFVALCMANAARLSDNADKPKPLVYNERGMWGV